MNTWRETIPNDDIPVFNMETTTNELQLNEKEDEDDLIYVNFNNEDELYATKDEPSTTAHKFDTIRIEEVIEA